MCACAGALTTMAAFYGLEQKVGACKFQALEIGSFHILHLPLRILVLVSPHVASEFDVRSASIHMRNVSSFFGRVKLGEVRIKDR